MATTRGEGRASLSEAVTAIPGVLASEPGVASTLRAVDARIRRVREAPDRFGIITDDSAATVIVEVRVRTGRLIREIVTEVQLAVQECLQGTPRQDYSVHVRVQSVRTSR